MIFEDHEVRRIVNKLREQLKTKFETQEDLKTSYKWQWQSNPDPKNKYEIVEWSDYSSEENEIINKAIAENIKIVKINKDYKVDLMRLL